MIRVARRPVSHRRASRRSGTEADVKLILYGSFNCPYSYLASLRADRLDAAGVAQIDWRAVVHDPGVPSEGVPVTGELAEMLDRELEEIRGLLGPDEPYPARRPPVQPNTTAAVAGLCALPDPQAGALRAALFGAHWVDGEDIGRRRVLDRLGCPAAAPGERMRAWQAEWAATERAMVPLMLLPGGKVSRGSALLGAMTAKADRLRRT